MDYLAKYTKLIPCFVGEDLLIAERVALLFFQNVVQYFGIPISTIHNRTQDLPVTFGNPCENYLDHVL